MSNVQEIRQDRIRKKGVMTWRETISSVGKIGR